MAADFNINNKNNQNNSIYNEWNTKTDMAADIEINNNNNKNTAVTMNGIQKTP